MRRTVALLAVVIAFGLVPRALVAETETTTLVTGRFLDPDRAGVLLRDGKIVALLDTGDARLRAGYDTMIDAGDSLILPGLVDAGGMTGDAMRAAVDPITPDHLAIDGFNAFSDDRALLARGITTTWLSPNRGRLLSGRGAVVKTAGDDRVLVERSALRCTLGREGLNPPNKYDPPMVPHPFDDPLLPALPRPPSSRAKAVEMLREALRGTTATVRIHASGADEIVLALDLVAELKLRAIYELDDPRAALPFAARLGTTGAVVVEGGGRDAERLLERLPGIAMTASPGGSRALLATAASAGDETMRTVTLEAARAIGVAGRVGSIEVGKDADLIFVDGALGSTEAVVRTVIVDGEVVYERKERKGLLAIRAKRILIGDGGVIENGVVVCADGRIVDVGADVAIPRDAERIVFDGTLVPGFIDAWSTLGLPGGDALSGSDLSASPDPARLKALRESGVTSLVLVPRSGSVVGGWASVVKTSDDAGAWKTVSRYAATLLNFSTTGDRAQHALSVRDTIASAKRYITASGNYQKALEAHRKDPKKVAKPKPPRRDPKMDALSAVLQKRATALVRAERVEEIAALLAFAKENPEARFHLLGGSGALDHADALRARGMTVFIAGQPGVTLDDGTRASLTIELARRRLTVASGSGGSSTGLLGSIGVLVRGGLSPRLALASLTSAPADALGVASRIGRVARGCDADLVLLTKDPGEPGCRVHAVVADGAVVHLEEEAE